MRGAILRGARSRAVSLAVGIVLAAPGAVLTFGDFPRLPPFATGLGLILLATGVAFILIGLLGRRPDWTEP